MRKLPLLALLIAVRAAAQAGDAADGGTPPDAGTPIPETAPPLPPAEAVQTPAPDSPEPEREEADPFGGQAVRLSAGAATPSNPSQPLILSAHLSYEGHFPLLPFLTVDLFASIEPSSFSSIGDRGSSIALRFVPEDWRPSEGLALVFYPVSSVRLRGGEQPLVSWGAGPYSLGDADPAGSVRAQYQGLFGELGLKTRELVDSLTGLNARQTAVFGRGRWTTPLGVAVRLSGAWIPLGNDPGLGLQGIRLPLSSAGASAGVRYAWGHAVQPILAARRESTAPEFFEQLAQRLQPENRTGLLADLEVTHLEQTLVDPTAFGRAALQGATAAQLRVTGSTGATRVQLLGAYRDAAFLLEDRIGLGGIAFGLQAFPATHRRTAEYRGELTADHALRFGEVLVRPGVTAELVRDASFGPPLTNFGNNNPPAGLQPTRTIVRRDPAALYTVPGATDVLPRYRLGGTLAVEATRHFRLQLDLAYERDPLRGSFDPDTGTFTFLPANGFSAFAYLQARL